MPQLNAPVTRIIHERLGRVMAFAFSREPLEEVIRTRFTGEWKYLKKALFELAEVEATQDVLELALWFRSLDDSDDISSSYEGRTFGELHDLQGNSGALKLRDVPNKIIHSRAITWDWAEHLNPKIICFPHANQSRYGWSKAVIPAIGFASVCGSVMS